MRYIVHPAYVRTRNIYRHRKRKGMHPTGARNNGVWRTADVVGVRSPCKASYSLLRISDPVAPARLVETCELAAGHALILFGSDSGTNADIK